MEIKCTRRTWLETNNIATPAIHDLGVDSEEAVKDVHYGTTGSLRVYIEDPFAFH